MVLQLRRNAGVSILAFSIVRYYLRRRFFQRQTPARPNAGPEESSAGFTSRGCPGTPQSLPVGDGVSRAPHSSACTTFVYPEARLFLVERFRIPRSELLFLAGGQYDATNSGNQLTSGVDKSAEENEETVTRGNRTESATFFASLSPSTPLWSVPMRQSHYECISRLNKEQSPPHCRIGARLIVCFQSKLPIQTYPFVIRTVSVFFPIESSAMPRSREKVRCPAGDADRYARTRPFRDRC